MTPSPRNSSALTRIELIVAITICALLVAVAVPVYSQYALKNRLLQSLCGSRLLYIASFSMAADYGPTKDDRLGWPGDLYERKTEPVTSVTPYLERLMEYEYLKKIDMAMTLRKAGGAQWQPSERLDAARHCPFKIYCVKESDGASVLFCATRNFTYRPALDPDARPHGNKGFTVFRKGGDGAVFTNMKTASPTNLGTLGLLPGRVDFQTRTTETAEDFLVQR